MNKTSAYNDGKRLLSYIMGKKKRNFFTLLVGVSCSGVEMTEVLAVESLSSVLTFPLDVARGVLPIEGEVECVRRERARHPTY